MFTRIIFSLGVLAMLVAISCDRVPLLAPTNSTVTLDAGSRVVETGGSTSLSAMVIEESGTPVQNGTVVRFTTTLGRLDPVEAQTRNGVATTTFFAGNDSGVAEVRATSGGAGGSSTTTTPPSNGGTTPPTTTTTTTNSNVVLISVGAAAVETVTLRANPSSVSTGAGGTVTVTATVVGVGGRLLSAIPVSFTATRGTLSGTSAVTDAQGEARVTLTTNGDTDITAAAGTKTATAKVTGQPGPAVALTCTIGTATTCATATVGQTIVFNAARAANSGTLTSAILDFGDNSSLNLGTLASATNAPHAYSSPGTYTVRLTGTDANGESSTSVQIVQVNTGVGVTLDVTANGSSMVTAVVTVTGGTATQYAWTFQGTTANKITSENTTTFTYTAPGPQTVSVTVTLADGTTRTVSKAVNVI